MKQKKHVLALILLLYPLRHCMIGLDLMDAGYALGNYRFYNTMNETWKLATYLSNVLGMILMHLPYGNTWIGMNVYTSLLIGITSAVTYLFMVNLQPNDSKKEYMLFISEVIALSLCWAPSTILYHYLGYILMTVATLVLYTAIIKDNSRYYIVAGVILGLCVAVRMPNITYMAFILPLWYYCFIERKNVISRTLYCIAGYIAGLAIPIAYIEVRYGLSSYPDMITSLFGMTDTATDYKPTSMITAMFGDYKSYSVWLLLFVLYTVVGIVFFNMVCKIITNKLIALFKILYILGFMIVLRFCYGRGMFGLDFTDNFSMYKWLVVYLMCVILLSVWAIISGGTDKDIKLWSVFIIVTIFITPLGSNNGLYPIINNLFIVAPISVMLIIEFIKLYVNKKSLETQFVIKSNITFVMLGILVVSILYGIYFNFHDYPESDYLENSNKRVSINLKCSTTANGLLTTGEKKDTLESLDTFLYDNSLTDKTLITYGDIPALSYIFDMTPAIYTTWGDLDSNPLSRLEQDLEKLDSTDKESLPLIIIGTNAQSGQKLDTLRAFILDNGYEIVFENTDYIVYQAYSINYLSN